MSALVSRASRRRWGARGAKLSCSGTSFLRWTKAATQELSLFRKRDHLGRPLPIARVAYKRLSPRLDTPLVFPAPEGGYLSLDNFRTREWYEALDAAGVARRGPYHLRHTFATEALAAGVSIFELARVMGASVKEIDRTYGHLARDSEDAIRARLEARADRSGVYLASDQGDG